MLKLKLKIMIFIKINIFNRYSGEVSFGAETEGQELSLDSLLEFL